jgi:hypothetical protein
MAQRKETKTKIKVRDLKPKKDARGGRVPPGGMPQAIGRSVQQAGHSQMRRGDG